jgi:hypothetical protein
VNLLDNTTLRAYLTCALWSSTGEDGVPLDEEYSLDDLAPIALLEAHKDVQQALTLANGFVPEWGEFWSDEQFGHDFWLTRNGHGAGFWDRYSNGPEGDIGQKLTEIAKSFGGTDPYVGDDALLYFT